MDILLGNFVKKYINKFDDGELSDLNKILSYEDEVLHKLYFGKNEDDSIFCNKVMKLLKEFKL